MKPLKELTRPNIWALKPYSSARDEYSGKAASVFLDANENPYNTPNNRYPDPLQKELKALIAPVKKVNPEQIFLGNGSDEAIDLLFRAFCRPEVDNVVAIHPTYGMYEVCADINDVEYRKVLLDGNFQFKAEDLLKASDENTKLMFLCSPNNPTGNNLDAKEIIALLQAFQGIVVIDEAYIDFSSQPSFIGILDEYPNLIILQTFSKAWGCAAIRLGMAFASPDIIGIFTKIKYPYNINLLTQQEALRMMQRHYEVQRWVSTLLEERARLMEAFARLSCCKKVFPTDANFFLTRVTHAKAIYDYLVDQGIIVRNRSNVTLCEDCLRITVGTRPENDTLLEALRNYTE
ncbi:histidinol-phosphate transaminase [Phocaeicola salanitronis]|uniref:histidinol-phosphate transaminase n=1 Tax=Phocaeicola salanitronis TaxID=376805 RepID=UPI0025A43167|nr:histidinol-phosphate transaminase [Phocaeicola salanitronis]MDM8305372.1 histidinol-phosphate transaminase [Phocaeicola salanitronis]